MATHAHHHTHISPWTIGLATFAGSLMILGGFFELFQGLAAVLNKSFFVAGPNYIYHIDITTWGWIHMILGAIIGFAGIGIFSGQAWARGVGMFLVILSAIANFFYIPYYPLWSMLIIALNIAIIGALAAYGSEEASQLE